MKILVNCVFLMAAVGEGPAQGKSMTDKRISNARASQAMPNAARLLKNNE